MPTEFYYKVSLIKSARKLVHNQTQSSIVGVTLTFLIVITHQAFETGLAFKCAGSVG